MGLLGLNKFKMLKGNYTNNLKFKIKENQNMQDKVKRNEREICLSYLLRSACLMSQA